MQSGVDTTAVGERIDPGLFRHVLGHFCSGVTIITAMADGPVGFTCQSFASLSLDPPLVLFSVGLGSRTWPRIRRSGVFCVNILATEQAVLCRGFAVSGTDKFAGIDWTPGPATGAPRLPGCLAWIECTIETVHPGGDHLIAVGRVRALELAPTGADPLLFYVSGFRRPAPELHAHP